VRLIQDYKAFTEKNGIDKKIGTLLLNPNFHTVCLYRLSNLLYGMKLSPLSKIHQSPPVPCGY